MDKLISLEPSSTVAIRVEPGQKCTGTLVLRNVMYTMPVAFRLQAFNKSRYTIRPQSGIIPPLATLAVEITYHLSTSSYLPESFPHCDDSFVLHSVVVPGAGGKDSQLDSVPVDLFTSRKKQMFSDSGIRVMFVGGLILAQLIKEGSMDEIREVLEISDPSWKAVDSVDHNGHTLLHLAITQGRPDLVQLLLEFQPDIEARGRPGPSALEVAAASGEALIVELLLARGANTERFESSLMAPIHLAAGGGHMEVLRLLLLKGANVDSLAKDGNTALHLAVQERRRDCARLLLASGARADIRNLSDGDTPLHISSRLGDEQMIKLLLQKGANKDIRNIAGKTAFDVAAEYGHSRLFDALKLGDALCLAARKGEIRKIQTLIENGANINGRDQHGWTALHRASFKGKLDVVRALIEKGIDLDAKDEDGYTALHCAVESGFTDVVELLIKRGSDVEARTNKGVTPVQIAESLKYSGITRVLVHGGASKDTIALRKETQKLASFPYANKESDLGGIMKKKKYLNPNRGRALRSSIDRSMPLAVL